MGIHEELAQKHKSADERREAHNPIRGLLCYFLELAIDDLHSAEPIKRRRARWWIYEDLSIGVDTRNGYLSFQGTCEALDIDAQAVRKALKNQRRNGNGQKNGSEI
jgi:hypothetical protein